MRKPIKTLLFVTSLAVMIVACDKRPDSTMVNGPSNSGISPIVLSGSNNGGNLECSDLNKDYEFSSGRINYDEGVFDAEFPKGFTVKVTDGKYVEWSFSDPDGKWCPDGVAVIVKGGNAANVYYYNSGVSGDAGLAAPVNASGKPAGLSNLTFCYNLKPCDDSKCKEETAWADGDPYNIEQGNWATYVTTPGLGSCVDLLAGQHNLVGTVCFYAPPDGYVKPDPTKDYVRIKFFLKDCASLQDVEKAIKIQGYDSAPSGNPAPGQFTTYTGNGLDGGSYIYVIVPYFKYYGIHLDVINCCK